MSGKALAILTVLGLLCAPLAAQETEDPMAEDPTYQEPALEEPMEPAIEQEAQQSAEQTAAGDEELADEELPRTASPLALLALLGGAGVASGVGLRLRRRR